MPAPRTESRGAPAGKTGGDRPTRPPGVVQRPAWWLHGARRRLIIATILVALGPVLVATLLGAAAAGAGDRSKALERAAPWVAFILLVLSVPLALAGPFWARWGRPPSGAPPHLIRWHRLLEQAAIGAAWALPALAVTYLGGVLLEVW